MCLELILRPAPGREGASPRRLSEATGLRIIKICDLGGQALHFSVSGGCSCEFLAEDADWNDDVWALEEEHLPALAEAVALYGEKNRHFEFLAHWLDGEAPRARKQIGLKGLVSAIAANKVENNVVYQVGHGG